MLTIASLFLQALDGGISQKFLNLRIDAHDAKNLNSEQISKVYLDSALKLTTSYFFKVPFFIPILIATVFIIFNNPALEKYTLLTTLSLVIFSYSKVNESVIKNIFIGSGQTYNAYLYIFVISILRTYAVFFILFVTGTEDISIITLIFIFINLLTLFIYFLIRKFYAKEIIEELKIKISSIEIFKFIALNLTTTLFTNLDKITLIIFKPIDIESFGNYYIVSLISSIIFQIISPMAFILLPMINFKSNCQIKDVGDKKNKNKFKPSAFILFLSFFSLIIYLIILSIYILFDVNYVLNISLHFQVIALLGLIAIINIISWSITQLLLVFSQRIYIAIFIQVISILIAIISIYVLEGYFAKVNLAILIYGFASIINLIGLIITYYFYRRQSLLC